MKATEEFASAFDELQLRRLASAELEPALFERRAKRGKYRAQTPQQFANALNKRRAANKAARKARKR